MEGNGFRPSCQGGVVPGENCLCGDPHARPAGIIKTLNGCVRWGGLSEGCSVFWRKPPNRYTRKVSGCRPGDLESQETKGE
jgi:hypothetical protein